jgi:threonine aldolase
LKIIDLRSDTVTLPTPAMREAMYRAEVGDDVLGEDPTVNRLEEMAAERMGKEAALFVASGTMANLVCLLTYCGRGDEFIVGHLTHTFLLEAGASAGVGGLHPHTVRNQPDGTLDLGDVEAAIRGDNIHFPRTRLICLENTHNRCGGAALSVEYTNSLCELAHSRHIAVHLDGARIFNAAIALGVDVKRLTRNVDSVTFCLSKGLSCPVGSLVCGRADFIAEARRNRKMVGGGMRQAGIIAAAGVVALEQMIDRLAEDHVNARRLAEGLAEIAGLSIDLERVQTNIVYLDLLDGGLQLDQFLAGLREGGVKMSSTGPRRYRAVTHYGIDAEDIGKALMVVHQVMEGE